MSGTEPAGDNRAANLAWRRKEGRLFGVRGDRPRFETRPQPSPRNCCPGHAAEAGFGMTRQRCLLCLKPLQLRRSSTSRDTRIRWRSKSQKQGEMAVDSANRHCGRRGAKSCCLIAPTATGLSLPPARGNESMTRGGMRIPCAARKRKESSV